MGKVKDLTGQRFGRLVAIEEAGRNKFGKAIWKCKCDCGTEKIISSINLTSGNTQSCGCLHKEISSINASKQYKENLQPNFVEETYLYALTKKIPKNNTSGIKGVSWHNRDKKWQASIALKGKTIYLGQFNKLEKAAQARKEAEEKYFQPILEKYNITSE